MAAKTLVFTALLTAAAPQLAHATTEICGNAIDDDGNGMVDEGCAPTLTTGVCESPLSCGDSGMVSWSTGALHYDLPPDIAPKVPYGPGMGFRRMYTSMYSPPSAGIPNNNAKPMGANWQHTYMTWVTPGAGTQYILHTNDGRDVLMTYYGTVSGWKQYASQTGYQIMSFAQNTTSPFQFQEQLLTGEKITFNSSGQLMTITDIAGNSVAVTEDASGSTSTVTDASGKRRLLFGYTGTTLQTVKFQLLVSGTWTTEHTTTLTYTSGVLTSATVGSQLAQQYLYSGGYLSTIEDGSGNLITSFAYSATTSGRVNRVDTPRGSLGFDYGATRSGCPVGGGTQILFNRASATVTCTVDSDCASTGAGNMCGGKTGGTGTGACYQAGRCLTLGTVGGETVVTAATAVLDALNKPCDGVCADIMGYAWASTTGLLNVVGREDGASRFTSATYNAYGLPTMVGFGDADTNPANGASRVEFIYYDSTYPGRISEVRRASDLAGSASSCGSASTTGCARTVYTYNTTAPYLLHTVANIGTTLDTSAAQVSYTYTTTYTQDSTGRTTEIDGPVIGAKTIYDFWSSTDPAKNGFLEDTKQYSTATVYLTATYFGYDVFGNLTGVANVDGNVTCSLYDTSRNFLTQRRQAMAGQTDCTTTNGLDLTTNWLRDSALRITEVQQPDLSCILYAYTLDSTSGRYLLHQIKRRDDCLGTSAGDTEQYAYSTDGLLVEIDTYDASGTLQRKQPFDYYKARQLDHVVNPVNSSYSTVIGYDPAGLVIDVADTSGLGETRYGYGPNSGSGADIRVTTETRFYSSSGSDTWSFDYDFDGEQSDYEDGDRKWAYSKRDDMGREVERAIADFPIGEFTLMVYDAAGNLTTKEDADGDFYPVTATFAYDYLNRRVSATYSGGNSNVCNSSPYTKWSYDALPTGVTCPGGMASCANEAGRLAYITTSLICSSSFTDNSLDQQTYYSYDGAGRTIEEYITDDSSRVADHRYAWTKNGDLLQVILPSSAVIGWTYGSTGSNSDTDLISGVYRTGSGSGSATPIVDTVKWFPFGPIQQYNHENLFGAVAERTRVTRNQAYRISNIRVEPQNASTTVFSAGISEDAKGRTTLRAYSFAATGVQNSYFTYDNEDHVACETTTSVTSCPSTGSATIKNSHYLSPPFTHAGDWQKVLRPIPGWTAMENDFSYNTGTHQVSQITQPGGGLTTHFAYWATGNRKYDYIGGGSDERSYDYDPRGHVGGVSGTLGSPTGPLYYLMNGYDAKGRRAYKGLINDSTGVVTTWFYYYDPLNRLTEVRTYPNSSVTTTYTVYQLIWIGDRMVAYWETDYPSGTTSRRYTGTDEAGRIVDMQSWPSSGSASRVWAINPSAWGYDQPLIGGTVYQPLLFRGQYVDSETAAYYTATVVAHPALVLNGARTYDPFTGGYLQVDPLAPTTLSSYVYADSDPVGNDDPNGLAVRIEQCTTIDTQTPIGTNGGLETSELDCSFTTFPDPPTNPQPSPTGDGKGRGVGGTANPAQGKGPIPTQKEECSNMTAAEAYECCDRNFESIDGEKCRRMPNKTHDDTCARRDCWVRAETARSVCQTTYAKAEKKPPVDDEELADRASCPPTPVTKHSSTASINQ